MALRQLLQCCTQPRHVKRAVNSNRATSERCSESILDQPQATLLWREPIAFYGLMIVHPRLLYLLCVSVSLWLRDHHRDTETQKREIRFGLPRLQERWSLE